MRVKRLEVGKASPLFIYGEIIGGTKPQSPGSVFYAPDKTAQLVFVLYVVRK
ncbi:hypothetical protein D3C81_2098980 [compost metagenome]